MFDKAVIISSPDNPNIALFISLFKSICFQLGRKNDLIKKYFYRAIWGCVVMEWLVSVLLFYYKNYSEYKKQLMKGIR